MWRCASKTGTATLVIMIVVCNLVVAAAAAVVVMTATVCGLSELAFRIVLIQIGVVAIE